MMIRDIMWRFSGWYNRKLQQWINEQKPDCIFVNPGNAKFIYDIALKISEKYSLPIVTYLCDEYYFTDEKEFGIDVIWRKTLKDRIEKLMVATSHLIVICNDMEQLYSERFSVETTTIYTGSNLPNTILLSQRRSLNGITYMGNLSFNRLTSILDVANALEKINEQFNKSYKIYLYSLSVNDDDMRIIDQNPIIEYCGFVTGDDYYNILLNSNCVLHVEAFDSITVDKVKHSISTKIADCLASGVPLVAYGPESVASIKYLKKESCAFIATSKEFLETMLCDALFNVQLRKCVSEAGIKVARINHCSISNSSTLKKIIQSVNRHDVDGATKR